MKKINEAELKAALRVIGKIYAVSKREEVRLIGEKLIKIVSWMAASDAVDLPDGGLERVKLEFRNALRP